MVISDYVLFDIINKMDYVHTLHHYSKMISLISPNFTKAIDHGDVTSILSKSKIDFVFRYLPLSMVLINMNEKKLDEIEKFYNNYYQFNSLTIRTNAYREISKLLNLVLDDFIKIDLINFKRLVTYLSFDEFVLLFDKIILNNNIEVIEYAVQRLNQNTDCFVRILEESKESLARIDHEMIWKNTGQPPNYDKIYCISLRKSIRCLAKSQRYQNLEIIFKFLDQTPNYFEFISDKPSNCIDPFNCVGHISPFDRFYEQNHVERGCDDQCLLHLLAMDHSCRLIKLLSKRQIFELLNSRNGSIKRKIILKHNNFNLVDHLIDIDYHFYHDWFLNNDVPFEDCYFVDNFFDFEIRSLLFRDGSSN